MMMMVMTMMPTPQQPYTAAQVRAVARDASSAAEVTDAASGAAWVPSAKGAVAVAADVARKVGTDDDEKSPPS